MAFTPGTLVQQSLPPSPPSPGLPQIWGYYTTDNQATVSAADVEAQRSTGFIGQFYGTPIVVLPNSYTDETNTAWQLDNKYAYVMPTGGEKVVKVVLEGTTVINDLGQLPGDYSIS